MQCVVDIETLDTAPTAVILSIGAVAFKDSEIKGEFATFISVQDSLRLGRTTSVDTLEWWKNQSQEAAKDLATVSDVSLFTAIDQFTDWYSKLQCTALWGNGVAFDNVILRSAAASCEHQHFPNYKQDRCYRTVCALVDIPKAKFEGVEHVAINDARNEAVHLMKVLEKLNV